MNDSQEKIYKEIWDEHILNMRNYCNAKLKGRPEDAEDMLYHAFGLLWHKMVHDGVPPNPKAWLLATVNNLALTEYRNTTRERDNRSYDPFDETVHLYYSADDVAEKVEKAELNAALWKALLEELTDEERYIIKLDTIDRIPQAQIAEILGKTLGATKAQIFRTKRKLRKIKQEKEKELGFI